MCLDKIIRVRGVSCRSQRVIAAPCGVCPQCRKKEQLDWSFRLKTELHQLDEKEWYCVFFTMTYNDEHLPHFPKVLLNERGLEYYKDKQLPMCFSKEDVRDFHKRLRDWLESKGAKDDKRYKYMTCAEYGESTKRCHYHTLMCVPRFINPQELFDKVNELWTCRGFIFPKNINGGVDGHGYEHKPFVVESIDKACAYCAKYISKDIAFEESIDRSMFRKKIVKSDTSEYKVKRIYYKNIGRTLEIVVKKDNDDCYEEEIIRLSDYTCFHMQSRQLGKLFVDTLGKEKLEYLTNGYYFDGDEFCHQFPKYMREKCLYDITYLKHNDDRYINRVPNDFFKAHYKELFQDKVIKTKRTIDDFEQNYYNIISKFITSEQKSEFDFIRNMLYSQNTRFELAADIVAYYGVNPRCIEPYYTNVDFWMMRHYTYRYVKDNVVCVNEPNVDYEMINYQPQKAVYYEMITKYYLMLNWIKSLINDLPKKLQKEHLRDIAYIRDAFKSCEV